MDRPPKYTWPPSGRWGPVMTLMQVVLPDPLGPTRPRISPGLRSKLTPSRARNPPKRFTRDSTRRRIGPASGDIDPSEPQHGDEAVGEDEADNEGPVDQLEVLRGRDADGVVDAVEDADAEEGTHGGGGAPEQREDDREDAELQAEHRVGVEDGDAPGEGAPHQPGDEGGEQPRDDPALDHIDAGQGGADGVLADGVEGEPEARIAQGDDQGQGPGKDQEGDAVAEDGVEDAGEADAVRAARHRCQAGVGDDLVDRLGRREVGDG